MSSPTKSRLLGRSGQESRQTSAEFHARIPPAGYCSENKRQMPPPAVRSPTVLGKAALGGSRIRAFLRPTRSLELISIISRAGRLNNDLRPVGDCINQRRRRRVPLVMLHAW